jgi:phosphohistidine phosphatase
MRLLIVRHAIAQPSGTPDVADEDRRLTSRGKRRFRRAADGLARTLPRPDALLTSPLARALETAEIAATAWGRITPRPEPLLAAGDNQALLASLAGHDRDAVIAVVGHEPHVSALLGHLVGGDGARLPFRKGGAALVDLPDDAPGAGRGRLIWFLPPRLLRRLGRD